MTRTGMLEDSLTSYGDLVPTATLVWTYGPNNYMAYVTGNIPVGDYDPMRLSNIGLGHAAIDAGGAHTYLNPTTGNEFSGVAGFAYNCKNPDTQYRSGIDFHFDWGASRFLTKQFFVGVDMPISKSLTILARTQSWVASDHAFSVSVRKSDPSGKHAGFFGLRAYGEFDAANHAPGWNTWLTFVISPTAPTGVTSTNRPLMK